MKQRPRRILYVQYTNPASYPPLVHSSHILSREGWKVLFLGTGALGSGRLTMPADSGIVVRRLKFHPSGLRQKLHYLKFCFWVLFWTLWWGPRWVYASDALSCPVSLILCFFPKLKVVYHEHDLPFPSPKRAEASQSIFMKSVLWCRKRLARRAAMCVLPNHNRIERFQQTVGRGNRIYCVWNCPAQEEASYPREIRSEGDLWVLYQGSINSDRLPCTVLEALAKLPEAVKLRVVGYETVGSRGYLDQLKKATLRLNLSARVEFGSPGPLQMREDLLGIMRKCDVGLALVPLHSPDANQQTMVGASNKPFEYLACGLALLVQDSDDWRKMYVEPGYGLACRSDDPMSISQALRWFLDHPDQRQAMGEKGRQQILGEWNYERQFLPVLRELENDLRR